VVRNATKLGRKVPGGLAHDLHTDRLIGEVKNLAGAMGAKAVSSLTDRVEDAAGRLTDYAGKGGPGLVSALTGSLGGGLSLKERLAPGVNAAKAALKTKIEQKAGRLGKRAGKGKVKVTNIVESIDVGLPVRLVYDLWTEFENFPGYMKKVESVARESDEVLHWKAQVFVSHRTWKAHVIEQVPDKHIVWRSEGAKGHVDGTVSFHELAPELTRILLVLEYHPQGFFEHTGNLWRAQGRRARLEVKHFRRYAMTHAILHSDEIEGWRGEIREGEVVCDHETAVREEQEAEREQRGRADEIEAEEPEEEFEEEPEEEPEEEEEEPETARGEREEPAHRGARREPAVRSRSRGTAGGHGRSSAVPHGRRPMR
jgi:uncharacterized membrane protein